MNSPRPSRPFPFPQIAELRSTPDLLMLLLPLIRQGLVSFDLSILWSLNDLDQHVLSNLSFLPNDQAAVLLHACLQARRTAGEPLPVCPANCPEITTPRCSGFRVAPRCPVALRYAASLPASEKQSPAPQDGQPAGDQEISAP